MAVQDATPLIVLRPRLGLHPLTGKLAGCHAVRLNYTYRPILMLFITEGEIVLLDISTDMARFSAEKTLAGGRLDLGGNGDHGGKARRELREGKKCGGARRDPVGLPVGFGREW